MFIGVKDAKSNGISSQVFAAHSESDTNDISIFMVEVTVHSPFPKEKANGKIEEDSVFDGISGCRLHIPLADV